MKNVIKLGSISLFLLILSCGKDDKEVVVESNAKQIISFIFDASDNLALSNNIIATLNEADKTITATLPAGTDVTSLTPEISVSALASITPGGARDFSSPVSYIVTAEDGSTASYTATIDAPVIVNQNPLAFNLVTVPNNATNVALSPIFSWNASVDPDGDAVVYDLYLSKGTNTPNQLIAEDLSENSFEITERLEYLQEYVWVVVAKDNQGGNVSSQIFGFTTRSISFKNTAETNNAGFSKRDLHSTVVFDNKIWVIGGSEDDGTPLNDVWFSQDGSNWSRATDEAKFSARHSHTSVVIDNSIWIIGGLDENDKVKGDVWVSTDGENWKEVIETAAFKGRYGHTSLVFDNKIWLIGGSDTEGKLTNEVWSSTNGTTWNQTSANAPFSIRRYHTSVVLNGTMFIIGGQGEGASRENDVWSSQDGVTWTEVINEAAFTVRRLHTSIVFDNKIWLVGGIRSGSLRNNEVWYSEDGKSWLETSEEVPFPTRSGHTSAVLENTIFILGGSNTGSTKLNDVWSFD